MSEELNHFLSVCSPAELAAFANVPGPPLAGRIARRIARAREVVGLQIAQENHRAAEKVAQENRNRREIAEVWRGAIPMIVTVEGELRRRTRAQKRAAIKKRKLKLVITKKGTSSRKAA